MTKSEFDTLYRELSPRAFRQAYYLCGDAETARDAVHTAFLSLWEQRVPVDSPAAYVLASIRYQIASLIRSLSAQERFARLYPIEMEGDGDSTLWPVEEIRAFVDTQLSEAVRRVVQCVFYERLSYGDTAARLGISVATVNKHVVTALRQLRDRFN